LKKTKFKSKVLAITLAFIMVFGIAPVPVFATYAEAGGYDTKDSTYVEPCEPKYLDEEYLKEGYSEEEYLSYEPVAPVVTEESDLAIPFSGEDITVFVTIEGYNLGHGFYLEPVAVTLPAGSMASLATLEAVNILPPHIRAIGTGIAWDEAAEQNIPGSGSFYLASITGINRGFVNPPSYITVPISTADAVEGGALSEFMFTSFSGWMYTVNHVVVQVGADNFVLNNGDVIRWQFTVQGLGQDLGIGGGFGGPPLYTHADKTILIQTLFSAQNATTSAKNAALAIIINPLATAEQVVWATNLLLSGAEAPPNEPSSIAIMPNERTMFRGSSHTFTAVVQDQLGQNLPDAVLLSLVEGGPNPVAIHAGTTLANGLVSIHPEQAVGTMLLTATSGSITNDAIITIGNPTGIARDWNVPLSVSKLVGQYSNFGVSLTPVNMGATLYGHRIEWASADDSVIAITANANNPLTATVTAVSVGSSVQISARLINEDTGLQVGNPVNVSVTVRPEITGITIAIGNANREATQGVTNINLNVSAYPAGANFTGYRVERTIADTAVATLPNPGSPWNNVNATAVGAGITTSTAQLVRISDNTPIGTPITFTITVSPLNGLTIAPANANRTLVEGATLGTPVVLAPAGGGIAGSEIIRTSTNPDVITPAVGTGLANNATAHRAGTARIYAQLRSGGVDVGAPVYFDFTVTPVLSTQITGTTQLNIGNDSTLSVAQHGTALNASRFIQWTTSDASVVVVQEHPVPTFANAIDTLNNEITAVAPGTATVTAQLMTGGAANRVATGTPITFEITVAAPSLTSPFVITAPTGANVQVFRQGNFHQITPLTRDGYNPLADGMSEFGFPAGGTHYRVSMNGKITRTGFVSSGRVTVTFGENEDPQTQENQIPPNLPLALRVEASTMVNVNTRNHLTMSANETFRLRGFRAAWEIINGDTTNMIVQPDFHINVVYGNDVIDVVPVPYQSHWFDITATQAGTAIIEVYYDAIRNVNGGNDNLYAATHPVRRSVVVITVDGNTGSANFGSWDTEFDTVYYLNTQDNGYFPVNASGISFVQVAHVINGTMSAWLPVSAEGGTFNVPVSAGNNVVRVTNSTGQLDYQVVRAAQITPMFANLTHPGQTINPGDRFTLRFEGLFAPAPKIGNIYNPTLPFFGEPAGNRIGYTFNGTRVYAGDQYRFINMHTMTFTAPNVDGRFYFTNGNMPASIFGFGGGFGTHRTITDAGTDFGGMAPTFRRNASILPDVPITIGAAADEPPTWEYAMQRGLGNIIELANPPIFGSVGGEWAVLALARAEHQVPHGYFEGYINRIGTLIEALAEHTSPNHTDAGWVLNPNNGRREVRLANHQSTENARLIVALTSLGVDASNFYYNGNYYDLVARLGNRHNETSNAMWGENQGLNGPIWNLIALNSRGWDTPYQISDRNWVGGTTASNPITLDERIRWILDAQLNNGGWNLYATTAAGASDPDMTAMAIQALTPFYNMPEVATAISNALAELSRTQLPNGGWAAWGTDNVQSPAQVIVALTALGIDPTEDLRFVKPQGNPVTTLLRFFDPVTGGFIHDGNVDLMATEQAVYSLVAYWRFIEEMNALYNMSDAFPPPTNVVDKIALNALIANAQSRVQVSYTPATWAALQTELVVAIQVRDNANVTQNEVDAIAGRLSTAISALNTRADLAALNAAITAAEARTQASYTSASWTLLQNALTTARQVRNNENATQNAVNTAATSLTNAIDALVLAGGGGDGPGGGTPTPRPRVSLTVYNPHARAGDPALFMQGRTVRQMYIYLNPGETAYSILHRPEVDLLIQSTGHPTISGRYVQAINNFGEFDGGPYSGWMYVVNRVFPARSASLTTLRDGDVLKWLYTYELGSDIMPEWGMFEGGAMGINRSYLRSAIARAEERVQSNYTTASWASFQTALSVARQIYSSVTTTQNEIDTARNNLTIAIDGLVNRVAEGGSGGTGGGVAQDNTTEDEDTTEDEADNGAAPDPEAKIDEAMLADGGAVAEVIENLIRQAYEDGAAGITISVPTVEDGMELELIVRTLREAGVEELSLTIRSDIATLTLDSATLAGIAHGMDDYELVRIVVEVVDTQTIQNALQQESIGNNTAMHLVVMVGNTVIGTFDGIVTVAIPYSGNTPAEDRDLLTVYHVDSFGNINEMRGAKYENAHITFATNHFSIFFISEWMSPFADVTRNVWYFRNVRFAYSNGLMTGTALGQFSPDTNLSRAMMVTLLWRIEGMPTVENGSNFNDVEEGRWYSDAVAWASANGIINGVGGGAFAPNANIAREQLALMLQNYMRFSGVDVSGGAFTGEFADIENISAWALDAMMWANASGLITGRTLSTLVPEGTATRAEAAAILQRFLEMK